MRVWFCSKSKYTNVYLYKASIDQNGIKIVLSGKTMREVIAKVLEEYMYQISKG